MLMETLFSTNKRNTPRGVIVKENLIMLDHNPSKQEFDLEMIIDLSGNKRVQWSLEILIQLLMLRFHSSNSVLTPFKENWCYSITFSENRVFMIWFSYT